MKYGLRIRVRWVDSVLVDYVHPLDGPTIDELPRVVISPDGSMGVLALPTGLSITATYELVTLSDEEHDRWSAVLELWERAR